MNFATFFQYISLPFVYILILPFYILDINNSKKILEIKPPVIFASNHIAVFDSFLLRIVLKGRTDLLPVHFMASSRFRSKSMNFFWKIGLIPCIYKIFGVFTVPNKSVFLEKLIPAINIINSGKNIYFFPEGEISRYKINSFKKGAAALAIITGAPLIPMSLKIKSSFFFRKKITINIGDPLYLSKETDFGEATRTLQDKVTCLYEAY